MPEEASVSSPPPETSGGTETGSPRGNFLHKVVVSVVVGLLAVGLILVFSLYKGTRASLLEETARREAAEVRSEEQVAELAARQARVESLRKELLKTSSSLDTAVAELGQLRTDNARLGTKLEASQVRVEELSARLAAEEATLSELRGKLEEEREGQKLLFSKIERLMEEREELRSQLARTISPTTVELPPMTVTESYGPSPGLVGEVLAVNDRYGFVVVNLGRSEGIVSGDRFKILDHGMVVGEAEARRILDRMTVADLVNGRTSRRIRKNFKAVLYK